MNLDKILTLARKHLGSGEMESSARSCMADAVHQKDEGNLNLSAHWALKSLAYSIGILHADYARAWKAAGFKGSPTLPQLWNAK